MDERTDGQTNNTVSRVAFTTENKIKKQCVHTVKISSPCPFVETIAVTVIAGCFKPDCFSLSF